MVSVCGCGPAPAVPSCPPGAARAGFDSPADGDVLDLCSGMLPRGSRMRSAPDYRRTIRSGIRSRRPTVVVSAARASGTDSLVGFVVAKAVGNAVTRNRVKRRLRHVARDLLAATPPGTHLVVRALPAAADSGARLGQDLVQAWRTCLKQLDGLP